MSYPTYIQSYADWKALRTSLGQTGASTAVVTYDKSYTALFVSKTADRVQVYRADIIRFPDDPNLSDFESSILTDTPTLKTNIDDALAALIQ